MGLTSSRLPTLAWLFTLASVLTWLAAVPSFGQSLTYTGSTLGGPTWDRPIANNDGSFAGISPTATDVSYQSTAFFVGSSGDYSFLSTATSPAGWDNYLFLYVGSFSSSSPSVGYFFGNDDDPSQGLSGFSGISLTANTQYFLVSTGFFNSDSGSFSNTITGLGVIKLGSAASAPEPCSASLVVAALAVAICGLILYGRQEERSERTPLANPK